MSALQQQWSGLLASHPLMPPILAFIVVNGVATVTGAWFGMWYLIVALDFIIIVWFAQAAEAGLAPRFVVAFERGLAVLFPLLILAAWEAFARFEILNPRWFPPPTQIVAALWEISVTVEPGGTSLLGRPWRLPGLIGEHGVGEAFSLVIEESHLAATVIRVFVGFAIGVIPGIAIGALMGLNRMMRLMLDNVMSAVYVLPKIAIFPVVMLIFANPFGEGPKITVVAISAFFLVAFNTMAGVQGIEKIFLDVGKNYGASRLQIYRHVVLPGALPVIFAGLRLSLGTALIVIVAIEFIRANRGVGYLTLYYWEILAPAKMYAGLAVTMFLGVLLTFGLLAVERRIIPWRREAKALGGAGGGM